ncbi:protein-export membrane protein SecD [Candidatus Kaiserbacteria bacterium RIFCSPHIGHO2_01_FULL_46_22]|uniref:Protein translocase subunit SecD n=1 Tax=Candidatus Kaiserbacteria bacterium RIFCSPHIGHO2_01_FULL_46_22 TaxID=1798475 RepID=A0A1F6BYL2_9BACT|nr:MAG: protein-export membrane protein SecD [Candidatus Kaiserbacteria bacterium RIFCSPHIGHO2_01_FULL_46_22]
MTVRVFYALVTLALSAAVAFFVYQNTISGDAKYPFKFGLDLAGGSQLTYVADISKVNPAEVPELMEVLRGVIERRVNVFGVSEPLVQVEKSSVVAETVEQRLIVELPGVTDIDEAVKSIGETPLLEFKLVDETVLAAQVALENSLPEGVTVKPSEGAKEPYIETGLTGRYLKSAQLQFVGQTNAGLANEPIVAISFNEEGAELFAEITGNNPGKNLAIFLDGEIISSPRINERITGGQAIISGGFTPDEARSLAENLSFGALPVPIKLDSTETIGSSLGERALRDGVYAGVVGFIVLSMFMILWYRLTGLVAVISLLIYVALMLALFQFIPVVLTAAGMAGLILSIGLAVDANVLIAERIKEELRTGKGTDEAIKEGFGRAWLAIRDANVAHIIAGVILFWFGTSLIKGFALVLLIGVFVSMLSAITISRTLLRAIPVNTNTKVGRFLMSSGLAK